MADILPPAPIDAPFASYNWTDWYKKVRDSINDAANLSWSQFNNFSGSNLTDLETRNHNDLQNFQGGFGGEYYHLTSAQHGSIASGLTVVITTAALSGLGTQGSMSFTDGILTAQTAAT